MCVQVKIPNCSLYHYDVTITPDKCPRRVNREIIETLVNTHKEYFGQQKPVFDGRKNLYSRKSLPIGRERVRGKRRGRGRGKEGGGGGGGGEEVEGEWRGRGRERGGEGWWRERGMVVNGCMGVKRKCGVEA